MTSTQAGRWVGISRTQLYANDRRVLDPAAHYGIASGHQGGARFEEFGYVQYCFNSAATVPAPESNYVEVEHLHSNRV
jgi:hypothetical protein